MVISAINNTLQPTLTPKELLDRFKKGERPKYKVSDSDKMSQELDALAQKYKQAVSVDKKVDLISKEREMLYEELLNPELTLSRNYKEISDIMPKEFTPQEIDDTLRLFNITGISRIERLGGVYQYKTPKENVAILKNAYTLFDETTASGNRGRDFVIRTLAALEDRNPKLKPFLSKVRISHFAKRDIVKHLKTMGVQKHTIYPELENVVKDFKTQINDFLQFNNTKK